MRTKPYQFAFHDNVSKTPPTIDMWERVKQSFEKGEKTLTREEKDSFFHRIQSNNSGTGYYRKGGWVFPFKSYMKPYLVKYGYERNTWREIWAFDKTCIRNSYYTNSGIEKIINLPTDEK
jgi:hypothetical protein